MTDMITTPIDERVLRGALELERTQYGVLPHRLPAWARQQFPDEALARAEAQPSGVRLAFRTKATAIELDVLPTKTAYRGIGQRPDGIYDLVVDGNLTASATVAGGNVATIDMMSQTATVEPGPPSTVAFRNLSPALKDVVLWLPHTETTELIALSRQLDQPWLDRRQTDRDLAGARSNARWCRVDQSRVQRQCPPRSLRRQGDA
jgi:hypothetical protein